MQTHSPIHRNGIEFPRLGTKSYGELESACRAKRKASTSAMADECELKGQDRFVALKTSLNRDVTFADVDDFLGTHDGAKRAFHLSLKQSGKTEEQINEVFQSFAFLDAATLARELAGFIEPAPQVADSTGDEGDQQAAE